MILNTYVKSKYIKIYYKKGNSFLNAQLYC